MRRSAEARKVLADYESQLAAASARRGEKLSWSPAEREVLDLICAEIDRKQDLRRAYTRAGDVKVKVKLSAELRLLETSIARLMKQVHVDVPAPASRTRQKAQKAARARWNREGIHAVG